MAALTEDKARDIGVRARERMLAQHTYAHRAIDVEQALGVPTQRTTVYATNENVAGGRKLSIVMLGLSITSSWGNGHATTYRSLVRELSSRGHDVLFLERDVPWYAQHRDLAAPPYARTALYANLPELYTRFEATVRTADLVIVGSYVPDGIAVGRWVQAIANGTTAFYDIDTPVTLARLATRDCEYLDEELLRRYGLYLSFTGGPTLEKIERRLGARCARALYCSVDPALYAPESRPQRWDLGYMGTYSDDRQPALQRLLVDPARSDDTKRFVVAGAQYPAALEWAPNIERIEHLAPDRHRAFYNELGFTLNITRKDMVAAGWSPSVRLFEAAACGVPIITDAWAGLDSLFEPNREILIANTSDDVSRFLRDVSATKRRDIGEAGRARVLAAHTAAHRAADLERYYEEVV